MLVVVPMVLTLLSLVFGAGLRQAARRVRGAGGKAYETLDRVAEREQVEAEGARTRVDPFVAERARVSDEPAQDEPWEDEDEASEDEPRRNRS
jgi:hypothetical protein